MVYNIGLTFIVQANHIMRRSSWPMPYRPLAAAASGQQFESLQSNKGREIGMNARSPNEVYLAFLSL